MMLWGLPIATAVLDIPAHTQVLQAPQPISTDAIASDTTRLVSQSITPPSPRPATPAEQLDLDPAIIDSSPVLQRWLDGIPDVQSEIRHDPSFRTRLRLGYFHFPSQDEAGGWNVGIEDVFVGRTGITLSSDYQTTFDGDLEAYGADIRYYTLPLGHYVNIAPIVGYRHIHIEDQTTEGINLGARLMLSLSRSGAADIALTHTWTAPGSDAEVGTTTLSFGYAITDHLRLATDFQRQAAKQGTDRRLGVSLEWMF